MNPIRHDTKLVGFELSLVKGYFENPRGRKKAQQQGQQRVGKQVAKPLGPSGTNNGSQAHEINKMGLKEVNGLKEARK